MAWGASVYDLRPWEVIHGPHKSKRRQGNIVRSDLKRTTTTAYTCRHFYKHT